MMREGPVKLIPAFIATSAMLVLSSSASAASSGGRLSENGQRRMDPGKVAVLQASRRIQVSPVIRSPDVSAVSSRIPLPIVEN